jgi:diacylglycerol kinase (ATP)
MKAKHFSLRDRANSFRYAFSGIKRFFQREHNARIHLAASVLLLLSIYYIRTSRIETIALLIVMGMVWLAEILNTAIERIMDLLVPERRPEVKLIKDLSAAAVLVTAVIALATAAFIFIPKLI